jgi:hypothetical protein
MKQVFGPEKMSSPRVAGLEEKLHSEAERSRPGVSAV